MHMAAASAAARLHKGVLTAHVITDDELLARDGPGLVLKLRKAMAISLNDGNVSCKIDNLSILRYF